MEVYSHLFLTSILDGEQQLPSGAELFTTGKGNPGSPLMES